MSIWLKIGLYIVFLAIFFGWMFAINKINQRFQNRVGVKNTILSQSLMIVLGVGSIFLFVWLLTGFWSGEIFFYSVVTASLGLLIVGISWPFLQSREIDPALGGMWAGMDITASRSYLGVMLIAASWLVILGYLVAAGFVLFGYDIPSEPATRAAFRVTLIFTIGSHLVLLQPLVTASLLSKNVDDNVRTRFLIVQFGSLVPNALYLSLILWSFGVGDRQFSVGSMIVSPVVVVSLFAYLVALQLLPYLIGVRRAHFWRSELSGRMESRIDEVTGAIDFENPASLPAKLDEFSSKAEQEITEFVESDKLVEYGVLVDEGRSLTPFWQGVVQSAPALPRAYEKMRPLDVRFKYLDFLSKLAENTRDLADEIRNGNTTRIQQFSTAYKERKKSLAEPPEKRRVMPVVLITFVATTVISGVLGEISDRIGTLAADQMEQWLDQ